MTNLRILCCVFLVFVSTGCSDTSTGETESRAETKVIESNAQIENRAAIGVSTKASVSSNQAQAGDALYAHYCGHCHNAGDGHPGTMRLAIRLSPDHAVIKQRDNLAAEYLKQVVRNGLGMMPAFRPTEISDAELNTLAAYITQP